MDGIWAGEEWTVVVAPFLAGLAVGALTVYVALRPDHAKRRELEVEIDRLTGELTAYREQVYQHFRRTSDLFQGLTASYRAVYEHLAGGAQALCSGERLTPALDLPEQRLLAGTEGTPPVAPARTAEAGEPSKGVPSAGGEIR